MFFLVVTYAAFVFFFAGLMFPHINFDSLGAAFRAALTFTVWRIGLAWHFSWRADAPGRAW